MSDHEKRRYRYTRDILLSPIAGCLYFLVNPRVTWLRISYHLLRRRLRARGDRKRWPTCRCRTAPRSRITDT